MSEGSAGIPHQANVSTQPGTAAAPTPAFASQTCCAPAFGTQGATSTGHAGFVASSACALGFQGLPAASSFGSPVLQAALVAAGHASPGGAATAAPFFPAQASSVGAAAPFPPFSSFGAVTAPFPSLSSFGATDSSNPFFAIFEAPTALGPNPFAQSLKAAAPFPSFSSIGAAAFSGRSVCQTAASACSMPKVELGCREFDVDSEEIDARNCIVSEDDCVEFAERMTTGEIGRLKKLVLVRLIILIAVREGQHEFCRPTTKSATRERRRLLPLCNRTAACRF